jgi:predicted O-linked N-acetylglucosamine transferase (SPINDLY family)
MNKKDSISRSRRKKVNALAKSGRFDKAISLCESLCKRDERDADSWLLLCRLYKHVNKHDDYIRCLEHVVDIDQADATVISMLADEYIRQNKLDLADKYYNQVISLSPDDVKYLANYAYIVLSLHRYSEAEELYKKALTIDPSIPLIYSGLASCLRSQGKLTESIECYEAALKLDHDDIVMHSNYLLARHYIFSEKPDVNLDAHKAWSKRHIDKVENSYDGSSEHNFQTPLRVGYVSSDFRMHSVAYFILPLLKHHDREHFKIYCYSNVSMPDVMTQKLKQYSDFWRETTRLSDDDMFNMIENDKIDILVDLNGHTAGNRLVVFGRKPAPIQVTWLGYPDTTGLEAMDYRISDILADPSGFDSSYTEELLRIEGCFLCYEGVDDISGISTAPFEENGYITFGSFNNISKINEDVINAWSEIMSQVTGSRIFIKNPGLTDVVTRDRYMSLFERNGISRDRVTLKGLSTTTSEHLSEYNHIDLALDTFPYNGTTTTCESLAMGVPVLTVTGNTHANCVGNSLLSAVGYNELVTSTRREYIDRAVKVASSPNKLSWYRKNTRENMLNSILCDAQAFANKIESAYHRISSIKRDDEILDQ